MVGEEASLKLEPERVREKQDAYTSLTDLYGVEVFTDEFIHAYDKTNRQKEEHSAQITSRIFIDTNIEKERQSDEITKQLFGDNTSQVLMKETNEGNAQMPVFQTVMVTISMLAVILLYRVFWTRKRGGEKSHGNQTDLGFSR